MQETIDLTKYSSIDQIVLSGRPKGEELRRKLELEVKENQVETIRVIVPNQIVSLNSSFFLGLFSESVKKFGDEGFRNKYTFECRPILRKDIDSGIQQALNTSNPLRKK